MTGLPIWYELMSPDPAAIVPFYNAVIGWTIPGTGNAMPGGSEYREIARADGGWQGGVLTLTEAMASGGAKPAWLTSFHVDDVDTCVARAKDAGASVFMQPTTMDGIGRMAMLADPQGARFYLMAPTPPADDPSATSDVFEGNKAGRCAWNELSTDAANAQVDFYTGLLDWQIAGEMPMPGDHTYRFVQAAGRGIGAIGSIKPEGMPNAWLPYFRVEEIHAARAAIEANGGSVLRGPHQVPGDDWIVVARDPAGAVVGFVGKEG